VSVGNIATFAMNPAPGSIIVIADSGLWVTDDDGARWEHLRPPVLGTVQYYLPPQPAGPGPWRACASYDPIGGGTNQALACTPDGGGTWEQLPDLVSGYVQVIGIAPDGAILASSSLAGNGTGGLYRLAQGATRWQKLGSPPPHGSEAAFAPRRSGGTLWIFPAESDGAAIPDRPNDVYSAPYPY